MKHFASILVVLALLCGCLAAAVHAQPAQAPAGSKLEFRPDGSFKIIQVSDTQEFILSSSITQEWLYDLAQREQPDLFVLTGDNDSTGGASSFPRFIARLLVKSSVDTLMRVFDRIYEESGIPMTMVFGNHDNEATASNVTRAEQFAMYARHKSFIGRYIPAADEGTRDVDGQHYGTHNLLIYDHTGAAPMFNLWLFDSGSYDERGGYSCVQKPQIDWFNAVNEETGKLPSFAFQHIIVPEIYDLLTVTDASDANSFSHSFVDADGTTYQKYISMELPAGVKGVLRESPGPGMYNEGQYEALNGAGNVLAMFFGHDHVNTFERRLENATDLVNSPCSGFGSYGDIDLRGVRVITLRENSLNDYGTYHVPYQGFYGDSALREARLKMSQDMGTPATLLDAVSFKPLLWLGKLFA